jgi:thiosulfate/3-mercaptopyruvate sulfurtransferase
VSDISAAELAGVLDAGRPALLDVRTAAEFTGAAGYPCDPRQGHLPGARHLDVSELLACTTADEVRELVDLPEGAEVVAYCHSGSRSATAVSVLRAAGYDARNYTGSWHQWSADPSLPIER